MTNDNSNQMRDWIIVGRSVANWAARWEHIPDGFCELQPSLGHVRGLFAAKLGKDFMYIGAASQNEAGLRAGLARVRLPDQTGNSSHGLQMVKAAIDVVEAWIIRMESPITAKYIVELKWALIDRYQPPMNAPKDIVAAARKTAYAKFG